MDDTTSYSFIFTCPRASVDFDPHAGGARMMTVGQEADALRHKGMIQLLHSGQPRIRVARQYLHRSSFFWFQQMVPNNNQFRLPGECWRSCRGPNGLNDVASIR